MFLSVVELGRMLYITGKEYTVRVIVSAILPLHGLRPTSTQLNRFVAAQH